MWPVEKGQRLVGGMEASDMRLLSVRLVLFDNAQGVDDCPRR